jgi:Gpi18-like mannosyltransferase
MPTRLDERAAASIIVGRIGSWIGTPLGLVCLFALGLLTRLILARYSGGLRFDVSLFRQWSERLVQVGPAHFYAPGYFADYLPGYLYVLLALGKASHALSGRTPSIAMLKLPAIIADLGVGALAMLLAAHITPRTQRGGSRAGAAAAVAILLNPGLILISAVWGQVDSLLALLVLAGIYVLATGRQSALREACGVALLAMAFATKAQALPALPVIGVVLAYRHLVRGAFSLRAWSAAIMRVGLLVILAVAVVVAMFRPFGVSPTEIPAFYRNSGSVYPFTSLWAFNLWGAIGFYRFDVGPGAVAVAGIGALHIGLFSFTLATIAIMVRCWESLRRRVDPNAVALFGAVAVTCAAFVLLTRMHERYSYLAVVALAPFVGFRPFRWALAIVSLCFLLNVHFVYVFYSHQSSPPGDAWTIQPVYNLLFGLTKDAWQLKAFSAITAAACLTVASRGWRWLDRSSLRPG